MRVIRGQPGEHAPAVTGSNVRLIRPTVSEYHGMKPGFFVVRGVDAWRDLWEGANAEQRLPPGADFQRSMMIAASSDTRVIQSVRVDKLVDAENTLHMFVTETKRGKNCTPPPPPSPSAFDFALADRVDKPLVVHVDVTEAPGCGEAPTASVKCRIEGRAEMKAEVEATPGDLIECHADVAATGAFAIVERTWNLQDAPQGTAAKLNYDPSGVHTTFMTDMFGRYAVRYDVVDDAGRRGKADAVVNIAPPKTDNPFVQLAWTGFDANDDPATFPRVYLVAMRSSDATECSTKPAEPNAPPGPPWCDVKLQPTVRNMRLGTGGNIGDVPIFVHYQDDRYEGGAYLCVRTFFNGTKTAEICDKAKREAGSMWRPGVLDARTGTLVPPQLSDAGAPDAGGKAGAPSTKAGAKPAAKPAPKK